MLRKSQRWLAKHATDRLVQISNATSADPAIADTKGSVTHLDHFIIYFEIVLAAS